MGLLSDVFKGAGGGIVSGAFDFAGGLIANHNQRSMAEREYQHQKEFAQNGIRWKVEDARAAGIHPIYAIGANTPTYSPQAAVGSDFGLSQVGQDIGRAIEAKQTREERDQAQQTATEVGKAQADYYRAAAANQQAQADFTGQRSVTEALQDIRSDPVSQMATSSQRQVRTQLQQPSMPTTGNQGMDKGTPRYEFEYGLNGQRVALSHSQPMHDKYEDMFIVEYLPWVLGFAADLRYKITREPIRDRNGQWFAYNGEYYAPINIKTYRPKWHDWFRTHADQLRTRYGIGSSRRPADWLGG